ncbi:hypothetical protein QZH41_008714 [Actinostola sp. cb2023]|nr:hypothetical protein QZH41_008714 [Actinostola sp. cb2023]
MPKPSKGKKRKVRIKSDQRKKNAKRPKLDEESTHQNVDCETVKPESNEAEEDNEEEEQGLEKMLEEHAVRNNLSAINVKSILHHVITDKRVLDLVQKVIAEKEKEQSEETDDFSIEYEPKMTRSKYKQTNMNDDPIAQLTKSPLKSQKPVSTFTDLEFPESSSDEEYAPDEDEEVSLHKHNYNAGAMMAYNWTKTQKVICRIKVYPLTMFILSSDLASPFKPATPDTVSMDSFQDTNSADTTSLSVSRPLTRHRSQEVLFRKPETVSASTPDKVQNSNHNDLIAKRTRSLLPLRDKDLAYGMDSELPDFMPDLYDQLKLDDLDDDQLAFQIFLQSLANGDDDYIVAEDDDYEYDFMAENHIEEKEEYRNDRAVRITKKEVSDLFAELLQECNENEDDDILWSARSLLLDFEESDEVLFTDEQRAQLSKQMNQHVQLLAQVYLLSREQPTLQDEADVCRQYLNELQGFCDRSLSVHPIMALGGNMPVLSMFDVPGIKEAIRIVDEPFNAVKRPRSPRKQAIDSKAKTARIALPTVSLTNQTRMANSPLFREVILLPRYGFMDKDLIGVKELSSLRVKFTETEDYLLALGMKQFQRNWKVIQTHLLPVKTPKQLQIRCKNLYSSRAQDNIIKHLRDTKTLGKLPTDIIIYCDSESSRRFSPIPEPEWLISYRQKVKPQRKLLPPNPQCQTLTVKSRTQYPIIVSSSSRLGAYEVVCKSEEQDKQGGSNHASANVEKQAGELIPSNESEQRKHASIEASSLGYQQRDALPNYGETLPNNSEHSQIQTAKTLEESGDTSNHRAPNEQDEESDDQPLVNSPCISSVTDKSVSDNLKENINTSSPEVIHSKNTDLDNDDNVNGRRERSKKKRKQDRTQPSPGNDGDGCYDDMDTEHPIEIDDNAPCTPTVLEDRQDLIQGSPGLSSPGPSESTVEKNSKSSPIAVTTKSKTVRDKSASAATLSNSSCNAKKSNPSLTTLPPDPKEHIRAQALADSYLDRKALQNDQVHYEEFLCTLVESSACLWTPLYRRMEIVLSEYPELIEDFVAFLEPEQALEAGVLMESLEFIRARSFLRRLEVHFHKHRSHFQKIIEAFSTWNSGNKTPLELHEKVVPLLRGQQHLVDEFQSFFDNLKPSICSEEDFEEVEIGSGSDPEGQSLVHTSVGNGIVRGAYDQCELIIGIGIARGAYDQCELIIGIGIVRGAYDQCELIIEIVRGAYDQCELIIGIVRGAYDQCELIIGIGIVRGAYDQCELIIGIVRGAYDQCELIIGIGIVRGAYDQCELIIGIGIVRGAYDQCELIIGIVRGAYDQCELIIGIGIVRGAYDQCELIIGIVRGAYDQCELIIGIGIVRGAYDQCELIIGIVRGAYDQCELIIGIGIVRGAYDQCELIIGIVRGAYDQCELIIGIGIVRGAYDQCELIIGIGIVRGAYDQCELIIGIVRGAYDQCELIIGIGIVRGAYDQCELIIGIGIVRGAYDQCELIIGIVRGAYDQCELIIGIGIVRGAYDQCELIIGIGIVDDFEEVVIPDMIEPRKTKAKLKVRQTPASAATRTTSSTKQKLTPKPIGVSRTRNTKSDRRRNLSKKSPQAVDSVSRDDVSGLSEGEDEISSKKLSDGSNDSIPEKISQEITTDRSECDELFSEQNPSSIRTEGSASDCPLSVASSFHNDTSNDRDDDRIILSTCHHQGATSETFDELSTKLKGKTANEVHH